MGVYSMHRINGALQMLAEKEQVQQQAQLSVVLQEILPALS